MVPAPMIRCRLRCAWFVLFAGDRDVAGIKLLRQELETRSTWAQHSRKRAHLFLHRSSCQISRLSRNLCHRMAGYRRAEGWTASHRFRRRVQPWGKWEVARQTQRPCRQVFSAHCWCSQAPVRLTCAGVRWAAWVAGYSYRWTTLQLYGMTNLV